MFAVSRICPLTRRFGAVDPEDRMLHPDTHGRTARFLGATVAVAESYTAAIPFSYSRRQQVSLKRRS